MSDHDPAVRASDGEREHTATRLRDAVGEGRLTLAEAEERITAAYAAVHRADLVRLTADLPEPPRAASPPARRSWPWAPLLLGVPLLVAWVAGPWPFPWPVLLVALLVLGARRARRRPV
ncbi:DUF1707 SHOCT-like domain-containing protein [Saccharothrix obliqua]|uniref:DUF1707 SHOCT-like domain-containing protein n=1 Tax=Saccharothrix obliqua TaxID=2861747 RepID=UPI001C5D4287|nr:DUF1707 domain-containing protein [Saccharothrix obliqua]MBW4722114.1 DUF1707 domain-containing protein [Saccharothrix obliqua]